MRIKIIWKILFIVIITSISASAQGGNPVKGLKGAAKAISGKFPIRDIGGYRPFREIPKLGPQVGRNFNSVFKNQSKLQPFTESPLLQFEKIYPDVSGLNELSPYEKARFMREKMSRMWNTPHHVLSQPKEVTDEWWWEYIGRIIEDQRQMIQQGKERIEQQFDNKRDSQPNEMEKLFQLIPIRHDIQQEGDRNTSYIYYYAYGYELAA